jgi:hypothetical protein
VSTFYLLPPRSLLADHLVDSVQTFLPGVDLAVDDRRRLFASLIEALGEGKHFLVYREDLPVGEDVEQALIHGCGAETGDEVVEVRPCLLAERAGNGRFRASRWRIGTSMPDRR